MRTLALIEFLSVDGVMQGLGSPAEDTDNGFAHGGWGVRYGAAVHEAVIEGDTSATSAFLFGRRTYEKLADFWPHQPDTNPMANQLNALPKYVASRERAEPLTWVGAEYLDDDLPSSVTALKQAGTGDIVVLGSGVLAHQLLELDLVDELRLFIHPLILGTGKRLFRELPKPRELRLTGTSTTSLGTILATYQLVESRQLV